MIFIYIKFAFKKLAEAFDRIIFLLLWNNVEAKKCANRQ